MKINNIDSVKYSVLMSVYSKTNVEEFKMAVNSMLEQTIKPDQIVIVVDGEVLEDLQSLITDLKVKDDGLYTIVRLTNNSGLGIALNKGLLECRNEIVARMDTDDISVHTRIEKELICMIETESDIVGSDIIEFENEVDNVISYKHMPSIHEEIVEYMKSRCPLNHMTVLFKKSAVLRAGNYLEYKYNEDYYLWVRMYNTGAKFSNVPENLVYARIDSNTFRRRGGYQYYIKAKGILEFMYKNNIIKYSKFSLEKLKRFIVHVLMPNFVRQWCVKKMARSSNE